jgi:protein-L-isoaspartate O-methyltransferase
MPTRQSLLAVVKEHENLINVFRREKHLLFYYSLFPGFYRSLTARGNKKLSTLIRACFYNEGLTKNELEDCFGGKTMRRALDNRIVIQRGSQLYFTLSFVPFGNDIFARDPHYTYPPINRQGEERIWMGSDSIMFAKFLNGFLRGKHFDAALEVGSGSGIQVITAARSARRCVAIDYDPRAVEFTKINARLNNIKNLEVFYSNLFENVNGQFDLILANPWYVDLKTGALEEVPGIIAGLNEHLRHDGTCVMLLNSYVKQGEDIVCDYLSKIAEQNAYQIEMQTIGYNIEISRIAGLKENGISYNVMYYVTLEKGQAGRVTKHDCSRLRKTRDFAYINTMRIIHNVF